MPRVSQELETQITQGELLEDGDNHMPIISEIESYFKLRRVDLDTPLGDTAS